MKVTGITGTETPPGRSGTTRRLRPLKSPYQDGTTHIVMTPLEFMPRLAALVPRPRLHLIRFHGVLTPNAKRRPPIVPSRPVTANDNLDGALHHASSARMSWARLLKRVFDIDVEHGPHCEGKARLAYCTPRSEWWINWPLGGGRRHRAMRKASQTSVLVSRLPIDPPTTLRKYRSMTTAKYSQPCCVPT